jgi:hypothetical protein
LYIKLQQRRTFYTEKVRAFSTKIKIRSLSVTPDVMNAKYEPRTIKVVAYDDKGKAVAEKMVSTAGKPYALKLEADRQPL